MGVHPAAGVGGDPGGRVPPFVRRDVSEALASALGPGRFVLIVGESTAGKTRAAYEAVRTLRGSWRLIDPIDRQAIDAAVRVAQRVRQPCVVWLDDLERFLGTGGLTRAELQGLLHGRVREHCVVATMRTEEYARFTHAARRGRDRLSADAQRAGEDVLRLAQQIRPDRSWSPAEVRRATAYGSDPRMREAVGHAHTFGIAEYLAPSCCTTGRMPGRRARTRTAPPWSRLLYWPGGAVSTGRRPTTCLAEPPRPCLTRAAGCCCAPSPWRRHWTGDHRAARDQQPAAARRRRRVPGLRLPDRRTAQARSPRCGADGLHPVRHSGRSDRSRGTRLRLVPVRPGRGGLSPGTGSSSGRAARLRTGLAHGNRRCAARWTAGARVRHRHRARARRAAGRGAP